MCYNPSSYLLGFLYGKEREDKYELGDCLRVSPET